MKKKPTIFITVLLLLAIVLSACAKSPTNSPSSDEPDPIPPRTVYIQITGNTGAIFPMQRQSDTDGIEIFSYTISLDVGDTVTIYDSEKSYPFTGEFTGTVTKKGSHTFTLTIVKDGYTLETAEPSTTTKPTDPDPEPDPPQPPTPQTTKVTLTYTNSNGWANVYAYMWNYSSSTPKQAWPGEKLSVSATNGNGEKQYKVTVDYSVYDRIIFNNGSGAQTKDLIVGRATSGYYGEDGIFTVNSDDYGKVEYVTLTDNKNLSYRPGASKKIAVYTPRGYTTSKSYGVIYMFDSQNLFIAASGNKSKNENGSWAADVAVNNLIENGSDGVIIVAVDNADGYRDSELTMSLKFGTLTSLGDPQYGEFRNGKLDEMGNFLKETVMPYVKSHYSVDDSREKTGICGSSSGGLAAYYLGLRDNDLYGYIGALSPANGLFGVADWNRFYSNKNFSAGRPKVYVYCGYDDGNLEDMLCPAARQIKNLTSYGFSASDITENYVRYATHNEAYWRIAFQEFLGKLAS
ncbi:MAG: starch-binding protein [Clostridiales bacterium]|nr:starch-binding protein [Clostridiales bacterium]